MTSGGRRVEIDQCDEPGFDMLGGRLYFSRTMPDGSPFIRPGDKELRFDSLINGQSIRVTFDPRKMRYKGKLEI